jgi:starch-binding outer membrane protein, SusD/RagB family
MQLTMRAEMDVSTRTARALRWWLAIAAILAGVAGCSPQDLVGNTQLPSNLNDPATMRTPAGAIAAYNSTVALFRTAFGGAPTSISVVSFVATSGLLADELQDESALNLTPGYVAAGASAEDRRTLPELTDNLHEGFYATTYASLQKVRGQAQEARGLLKDYAPDASPALRGRLYALQGYDEMLLAELFCSGIPLSTVDYNGDFTLKAGSPTQEVFEHAQALFDTARTLSSDSARFLYLARIGTGRVLLDLGHFGAAAQAVADVPDGYRYEISYSATAGADALNFAFVQPSWHYTVSDQEGINGLPYRSSGDPRTASSDIGPNGNGATLYHPDKYALDGSSSIVLADWIEARLIEAEAALQGGDAATWLGKLNHLRETAISPALPDVSDPENADARVDLLFRERAFWLFLTGHRQGDLRRLIRQYGRNSETVYPTGAYPGGAFGATTIYGTAVNAPISASERLNNPHFTGCINRGA